MKVKGRRTNYSFFLGTTEKGRIFANDLYTLAVVDYSF